MIPYACYNPHHHLGGRKILSSYRLLEQKHAQAITSVCEMDHSPLWTMCLDETLSLKKYREACTNSNMPRQNLPTYYRINGALYIRKIAYINNDIQLLDEMEYAYIIPRENSIDIDTEEDFEMADFICGRDRARATAVKILLYD